MVILDDVFAEHYEAEIEGTHDCPDRIVSNAYFSVGCSGGGFRTWWRDLYGSDENLNNNARMRMAGRSSRRLRTACEKKGIPVIDFRRNDRKHEQAESLIVWGQLEESKTKSRSVYSDTGLPKTNFRYGAARRLAGTAEDRETPVAVHPQLPSGNPMRPSMASVRCHEALWAVLHRLCLVAQEQFAYNR